jgi:hypothetical protein
MFRNCKLGLRPHDPERVARVARLTPEVDPLISRTPIDWALGRAWDSDILGNDVRSNCAPVACVNWIKMVGAACGIDMRLGFDDVDAAYRAMGYDGTPETDNGVVLLDLLEWWTCHPIGGVKLDGFVAVGHLDDEHLATACNVAPLIVDATLTRSCDSTDTWDSTVAGDSRVWGDHAYLYHADSPGGGNGKTWGKSVFTTPAYRRRRWNAAFLPICRALLPEGVDADRLIRLARQL